MEKILTIVHLKILTNLLVNYLFVIGIIK